MVDERIGNDKEYAFPRFHFRMKNRKKWKSKKWKWDSFRRVNRASQLWARNQNASSVSHVTIVVDDR